MPAASAPANATAAAWRATFADLAALLLSFFVLVFSMSVMDAARWSALSSALLDARIPGDRVPAPPAAVSLTAPREDAVGATAADYLHVLLRQRLDRAPLVVPVTVTRAPDAVLVRFDAGLILGGEGAAPAAQGELLIARLIDLLAPLDNAVSLRVRPAVTSGPTGDRTTDLRAALTAGQTLRSAGFERPLAAYALAPDPAAGAATIEIVIHQDAAGG